MVKPENNRVEAVQHLVGVSIPIHIKTQDRISENLTEREASLAFSPIGNLNLAGFMLIVMPRHHIRKSLLIVSVLLSLVLAGWLMTDIISTTSLVAAAISWLVFLIMFFNEHHENKRKARALAALVSTKRYKTFKHQLYPLQPMFNGYFTF